jgi:HlyD family secretion protein
MKRWIIGLGVAAVVIGGLVYYVGTGALNMEFTALRGELKTAEREKLSIPIRASGLIEPASQPLEIKSKASGEVQSIHVKAGDIVQKGQLLLELNPKDERRNLERVEAEKNRAAATLEKAKVAWQQQDDDYPANVERAEAAVSQAEASLKQLKFDLAEQEKIHVSGGTSERVLNNYRHICEQGEAQVKQMRADLTRIRNSKALIALAEQDVALAQAAYEAAVKTWEDAQERVRETSIRSPIDGMVAKMERHVGEMIQSGTTSLTGGTLLMTIADISDLYVTAQVDEADISTVLDLAPAAARPGVQRTAALAKMGEASAARSDVPQSDAGSAAATQPAALTAGKPVKITVEAFREETFEGLIEHVSPEPLRQQSVVTYDVRIRISSDNRYKLLLGMQADAEFTLESVDAVVIPVDAVRMLSGDIEQGDKGERGVWMPVDGDMSIPPKKVWRKCRFGLDDGSKIEVIEGLKAGEKVFTKLPIERDTDKNKESS